MNGHPNELRAGPFLPTPVRPLTQAPARSPHLLTSVGELRWYGGHGGCRPARGGPRAGPPCRASPGRLPGRLPGGRGFPGAGRPGLTSCPLHFLGHGHVSPRGGQCDEDRRGDPLLWLRGHCRGSWWGWGQSAAQAGTGLRAQGHIPPGQTHSPRARSLPSPDRQEQRPQRRQEGWRCRAGEGRCPPGGLGHREATHSPGRPSPQPEHRGKQRAALPCSPPQ